MESASVRSRVSQVLSRKAWATGGAIGLAGLLAIVAVGWLLRVAHLFPARTLAPDVTTAVLTSQPESRIPQGAPSVGKAKPQLITQDVANTLLPGQPAILRNFLPAPTIGVLPTRASNQTSTAPAMSASEVPVPAPQPMVAPAKLPADTQRVVRQPETVRGPVPQPVQPLIPPASTMPTIADQVPEPRPPLSLQTDLIPVGASDADSTGLSTTSAPAPTPAKPTDPDRHG